MRLNLTKRNDTGLVNSSPKTAMTPIVRLQHQCNHTITIPGRSFLVIAERERKRERERLRDRERER